ncbi:MAG TPA: NADH-quinone oxidoreductase subunit L [Tepidisphaeraceae bacterium]|jgi:NADH-quinone oxidoreductase subunit L|nr:NADH-quinone oxidoreductase subunit L [Tepidisphaeraceae bacterium]
MQHFWVVQHSWLIPLLPLIGAAIAGFFGAKILRGQSHWPIWLAVGTSAVLAFILLFQTLALPKHEAGATPESTAAMTAEGPYTPYYSKLLFNWIEAGDPALIGTAEHAQNVPGVSNSYFQATASFFFDPLTVVMLCVVCGIGFLITIFSAGYMKGESGYFRFFAYLGIFIFMMTCLVMGGNLIMLYLGWEGVGLSSYLLIGYYYEKPAAREAAKKAFLVNRIGDFGFGIGIMLCYLAFGTVSYFGNGVGTHTGLLELANGSLTQFQTTALYWIPFCLMLGAFGKSAQFPLYVWLPDAMEGPTPVSALIHAATMVTAGVYMIARCGTLFVHNPAAMTTIAVIGCFTALLAATIALRQFDLKKVFAYSTISQLGFMFVGIGALAPVAGVFHLVTHAFFKALLFLSSGVVMHAMAGELDMRKMSGLKRVLPITHILMLIGCLALAGFPFLSGFFSKDDIVGAAFHMNFFLGFMLLVAAFMTAYYTFRLYFRVFQGPLVIPEAPADSHGHGHEPNEHAAASQSAIDTGTAPSSGVDTAQTHHDPHAHHNHEPALMMFPLIVLAIGALLAGYLNFPSEMLGDFLGKSPSFIYAYDAVHNNPALVHATIKASAFGQEGKPEPLGIKLILMTVSGLIALAGIYLAYLFHLKDRARAAALANSMWPIASILDHKYWVDEIYQRLIVENLRTLGKLLANVVDRFVVDGLVNLAGLIPQAGGVFLKLTVQRGYLQGYAAAMLFGIAIILFVVFVH